MPPKQKPGLSQQSYATPRDFIEKVKRLLGIEDFRIDLAASEDNAVSFQFFSKEQDSLSQPWEDLKGWCWLNPPFSHIEPWVQKAFLSNSQIALLIPASPGSNWWKEWVHLKCKVLFLNGRLSFLTAKPKWLYPKDLALLLYGLEEGERDYNIWDWRSKDA